MNNKLVEAQIYLINYVNVNFIIKKIQYLQFCYIKNKISVNFWDIYDDSKGFI